MSRTRKRRADAFHLPRWRAADTAVEGHSQPSTRTIYPLLSVERGMAEKWHGIPQLLHRGRPDLLLFERVLEAAGRVHDMGTYDDEVALDSVVGSVSRVEDFDLDFRPRRRSARLDGVRQQFDANPGPAPIELFRLGELHFVIDGHRRVAVARERNWLSFSARVHRLCTVAYARACLREVDLAAVAAERRFLEQLPLPDHVRRENWLQSPADWSRLADQAMAWAYRRQLVDGSTHRCAVDLASAWWEEEVVPIVNAWRTKPDQVESHSLPDLQVFVAALADRDGLGRLDWSDPLNEQVPCY